MAKIYHKLVIDEKGYKKFIEIKKRFYNRHNLKINSHVTEIDILNDAFDFILGDEE
jgi:hypothetical protein